MDFFEKHLKETLETIKMFSSGFITVKRIRIDDKVKSSDRSKINFIWRALKSLVDIDFLEVNSSKSPKLYRVKRPEIPLDVENVVSRVLRERNINC
ncbi:hypothetical protein LCGC14_0659540 [marine sediment metagenome]|uniref:Uncharacterized protein n=1 Tax=marine sediment metagenome TaxID=412755 RepID=A0A0F9U2E4_9ZZZZ|nr:hypothetical protein [bacterium]